MVGIFVSLEVLQNHFGYPGTGWIENEMCVEMINVNERENKIELSKVIMINIWRNGKGEKNLVWKCKWNDGKPEGIIKLN